MFLMACHVHWLLSSLLIHIVIVQPKFCDISLKVKTNRLKSKRQFWQIINYSRTNKIIGPRYLRSKSLRCLLVTIQDRHLQHRLRSPAHATTPMSHGPTFRNLHWEDWVSHPSRPSALPQIQMVEIEAGKATRESGRTASSIDAEFETSWEQNAKHQEVFQNLYIFAGELECRADGYNIRLTSCYDEGGFQRRPAPLINRHQPLRLFNRTTFQIHLVSQQFYIKSPVWAFRLSPFVYCVARHRQMRGDYGVSVRVFWNSTKLLVLATDRARDTFYKSSPGSTAC